MEFKDWIYKKYVEWRGDSRRTVSEFSVYLKISGATVSAWINGTRGAPTSARLIQILIEKFGDEVYTVLGISSPEFESVDISVLPETLQDSFRSAMAEIEKVVKERELEHNSEQAEEVARELFAKYGFVVTKNL